MFVSGMWDENFHKVLSHDQRYIELTIEVATK